MLRKSGTSTFAIGQNIWPAVTPFCWNRSSYLTQATVSDVWTVKKKKNPSFKSQKFKPVTQPRFKLWREKKYIDIYRKNHEYDYELN